MKILEVKKIEKEKSIGFEVEYEDNEGNKKGCLCEGEKWLEEENGQPKFIKRIIEEENKSNLPEPKIKDKRITKLNKFKDMVINDGS